MGAAALWVGGSSAKETEDLCTLHQNAGHTVPPTSNAPAAQVCRTTRSVCHIVWKFEGNSLSENNRRDRGRTSGCAAPPRCHAQREPGRTVDLPRGEGTC